MPAEFDPVAADYETAVDDAIAFARQPHDVYISAKARRLIELVDTYLDRRPETLDVGCGIGLVDRHLAPHLPSLHGVDVSDAMVSHAREANPHVHYSVYDGTRLPYEDRRFGLVFAVCVLHHLDGERHSALLRELRRVAVPQGLLVVFEHNPWNPLTRRVVQNCKFDQGVRLLPRRQLVQTFREADLHVVRSDYVLFFPWRTPLVEAIEGRLTRVPLGAQYFVAARPAGGPAR